MINLKKTQKINNIKCPYCENPAIQVKGYEVYPTRVDLYHKNFWQCKQVIDICKSGALNE